MRSSPVALEQLTRRGPRNAETWHAAADIVVNGMIRDAGDFALPDGVVEDARLPRIWANYQVSTSAC